MVVPRDRGGPKACPHRIFYFVLSRRAALECGSTRILGLTDRVVPRNLKGESSITSFHPLIFELVIFGLIKITILIIMFGKNLRNHFSFLVYLISSQGIK